MAELKDRKTVTPEDYGNILHYLTGSKTDELLMEEETLEKIGLEGVDREDLYIEMTIVNMFIIIKQYTRWEKDEAFYTRALDQMHFMLFHQLKEYSNYDEDDIEQLHGQIFRRYDEYGRAIVNGGENWSKVLSRTFLDNIDDEIEEPGVAILAKSLEKFYNSIPNVLKSI